MPLSARYASSPEGQPAAAKREAIPCDNHPDKVGTPAMGRQLGKSQKAQACPKAGQNRRLHRYVDLRQRGGPLHRSAPHTFLFRPCTAHFSFGKTERGPRRAPRGGERRRKGAGAVFAAGGNGAERTLRRRQWGAHPRWTSPPAGAESPEAAARRPNRFPESLRLRAAGIIAPCGCGAVFPNSPRLLPGRQTNRPRPPPGGQGPCNGRFTSCRAAPSCASRGPEWPCASAGSWG